MSVKAWGVFQKGMPNKMPFIVHQSRGWARIYANLLYWPDSEIEVIPTTIIYTIPTKGAKRGQSKKRG